MIELVGHGFIDLRDIAVGTDDNSYMTYVGSNQLFKFNRHHQLVEVVGGGGEPGLEQFNSEGVRLTVTVVAE